MSTTMRRSNVSKKHVDEACDAEEVKDKRTEPVAPERRPKVIYPHYHSVHGYLSHARPVHSQPIHSPFDKEASSQNYRGFLNLCMLLLAVHNLRLFLENAARYGLRVELPGQHVPVDDWKWFSIALALVPFHYAVAFVIEKCAATACVNDEKSGKKFPAPTWPSILHGAHLTAQLIASCYIVRANIWHPFIGFLALAVHVVTFLKLVSYAATNSDLRSAVVNNHPLQDGSYYESQAAAKILIAEPHWPRNIVPGNLLYFAFAPTLCYQTSYPRSPRFRKLFFVKRVVEWAFLTAVMYVMVEQYSSITLSNAMKLLIGPNSKGMGNAEWAARFVERTLKVSISGVMIWLMLFYSFFHSYLNALAEVLRFADREFYSSWWNSSSLSEYWKTWNKPVYNHFKRHIYLPCVKVGLPSRVAILITFLVSAALHELLVGLPIHALYGWAFFGMIAQVPLIILTARLEKSDRMSTLGNLIFWITFCIIGQPVMVLLYYRAWVMDNAQFVGGPPANLIPV